VLRRRGQLASAIFAAGAIAATSAESQNVMIWGVGTYSCGAWTASSADSSTRVQQQQWLVGFVSGYNWGSHEGENVTADIAGIVGWVDAYCSTHPLDAIVQAAARLVDELRTRRGLGPIIGHSN
jgi:hypothetical protein